VKREGGSGERDRRKEGTSFVREGRAAPVGGRLGGSGADV